VKSETNKHFRTNAQQKYSSEGVARGSIETFCGTKFICHMNNFSYEDYFMKESN